MVTHCLLSERGAKTTVSAGSFESKERATVYSHDGGLTISGGIFKENVSVNVGGGSGATIKGGSFKGEVETSNDGHMTLMGGKTTAWVKACHDSSIVIEKFTVNQGNDPSNKRPCLVTDQNGKITVKGGKFSSPNGIGYSGDVSFTMKKYKKLFKVKRLTAN